MSDTLLSSDAPRLSCQDTEASPGDANVFINCRVTSKPRPIAIFWIIDQFGTSVSEGDMKDGLRTVTVVSLLGMLKFLLVSNLTRI